MDHHTNPILCCLEPSERAVVNDDDDDDDEKPKTTTTTTTTTSQPPEAPMDCDGHTPPMENGESSPMNNKDNNMNHMSNMNNVSVGVNNKNTNIIDMDEQEHPYDVMAGMAETSVSSTAADGGANGEITESSNVTVSNNLAEAEAKAKHPAKNNNNNNNKEDKSAALILPRQDFHTPEFRQRLQEARAEKGKNNKNTDGSGSHMDPQDTDDYDYDAAALQYDDNHLRTPEEDIVLQQELAARQAKVDQELQDEQEYKQDQAQDVVAAAAAAAAAAAPGATTTNKDHQQANNKKGKTSNSGTILEAAFVDPAYSWPPVEGEGKNAIELQASLDLLQGGEGGDTGSVGTTESMRQRMTTPARPVIVSANGSKQQQQRWWWQLLCCSKKPKYDQAALEQVRDYEARKVAAKEARKAYAQLKKEKRRSKETALKKKQRYNRVPEGILIYRLDTSQQLLSLMSPPAQKTNLDTLVKEMTIASARPSPDKSRRGIVLQGADGQEITLVACEQRTATAWLEAIQIMLAKELYKSSAGGLGSSFARSGGGGDWSKEKLPEKELETIEEHYMNLANYSNKLIRAGALPGGKKGSGGAGGIYYSVEKVSGGDNGNPWDDAEEEALEAIAKRRAVIKDSWDFYRMICSLLRDRHKYDEVFRRLQLDPVYPYLNSMTGLNDPGDAGYENPDKIVMQPDLPEYITMSKTAVAQALVQKAETVMPSLVEICKALAGSLGMEEVGVGPVKDVSAALRKAEKKYDGDLLKITDYCRALLVVKDFPSLLALLELARDSFGPLIRRVKMSTLKSDHKAKPGGYRDCIINVELKDHICEIQIHLWPMWVICGVDGFRHYRHCVEYSTDSFDDAYDALDGLDRKTMAELVVMAEEAVAETPLDNLEWYHEKYILDYFAEAGLFLKHGLQVWAEITFRHLVRLRTESPDIGPDHHETIVLYRYLAQSLRAQNRNEEAAEAQAKVTAYEKAQSKEQKDAETSLWDYMMNAPTDAYDMLMDPNRKAREQEEKLRKEVKASKRAWRQIRHERFQFLDVDIATNNDGSDNNNNNSSSKLQQQQPEEQLVNEEKKVESS